MLTHLDHVVILVHDLDRAVADYTALGFTVTPGGTHADGLTHNALIAFADGTYLELITFLDPTDTRDNVWGWRQFVSKGEGIIDYCVASDDLAADLSTFTKHGLTVSGPSDGGRTRLDGTPLRWRSGRFWQAGRELPFLIEDVTPRDLRVPRDTATQHANAVRGIATLIVAVTDLERQSDHMTVLIGSTPTWHDDRRRDARAATFTLGPHAVTLAEPASALSPLQQHIESIGLGPCEIVLQSEHSTATFDARLTHGARITRGKPANDEA